MKIWCIKDVHLLNVASSNEYLGIEHNRIPSAPKRLVLQVYLGSNTFELSAIHRYVSKSFVTRHQENKVFFCFFFFVYWYTGNDPANKETPNSTQAYFKGFPGTDSLMSPPKDTRVNLILNFYGVGLSALGREINLCCKFTTTQLLDLKQKALQIRVLCYLK